MTRPAVPADLVNGAQSWDANVNAFKDQAFKTPFPPAVFADYASLPSVAAYDGCIAFVLNTKKIYVSDGITWDKIEHTIAGADGYGPQFGADHHVVANMQIATPGAVASHTFVAMVPANRRLLGVVGRWTVGFSGGGDVDIGDGVDQDRFGAAISKAVDTTFGLDDATANPTGWNAAALDVVLTATAGTLAAGTARVVAFYSDLEAPTL